MEIHINLLDIFYWCGILIPNFLIGYLLYGHNKLKKDQAFKNSHYQSCITSFSENIRRLEIRVWELQIHKTTFSEDQTAIPNESVKKNCCG